jgi:hypothetical protein
MGKSLVLASVFGYSSAVFQLPYDLEDGHAEKLLQTDAQKPAPT